MLKGLKMLEEIWERSSTESENQVYQVERKTSTAEDGDC